MPLLILAERTDMEIPGWFLLQCEQCAGYYMYHVLYVNGNQQLFSPYSSMSLSVKHRS